MTDNNACLILETGSYMCKSGFSTDEKPRINYPLIYGYPKDQLDSNIALYYYGLEAQQNSSSLIIKDIFDNEKTINWDLLENFWHSLLFNQFELETVELPLLITQPNNASAHQKEKACELFFETFSVPSFLSLSISSAGIYSSGRINGLVIDCGHSQTNVTPVIEGLSLNYSSESSRFGGKNITEYLKKELNISKESARIIKEKTPFFLTDFDKEIEEELIQNSPIQLPDNTIIPRGKSVFLHAYEGVFKPDLINYNFPGVHELAFSSLLKNDFEIRRELVSNIIMLGGNSCFTYFNEKFQKELTQMLPNILKVKIYSQADRANAIFNGCGIFAALSNFSTYLISKSEYNEFGASIIHKKHI